jgi:hypothetical protein
MPEAIVEHPFKSYTQIISVGQAILNHRAETVVFVMAATSTDQLAFGFRVGTIMR